MRILPILIIITIGNLPCGEIMIQLPLYYMRFPQEIMGTYSDLGGKLGDILHHESPEGTIAYRLKTQGKYQVVEVWTAIKVGRPGIAKSRLEKKAKQLTPLQLKKMGND